MALPSEMFHVVTKSGTHDVVLPTGGDAPSPSLWISSAIGSAVKVVHDEDGNEVTSFANVRPGSTLYINNAPWPLPGHCSATLNLLEAGDATEGTLSLTLDLPASAPPNTLLILIVDQSGSMAGSAWRQVQRALQYIMGATAGLPHIRTEVITYNGNATRQRLHAATLERDIGALKAEGLTCFASAFDECKKVLEEHVKRDPSLEVVIGFMTDGDHTSKKKKEPAFAKLKAAIRKQHIRCVAHCIGFTKDHKFEYLNEIRTDLGTEEGGFQYAEPSDGPEELQGKMEAIFDVVSGTGGQADVSVYLSGFCILPQPGVEDGRVRVRLDAEGHAVVNVSVAADVDGKGKGKAAARKAPTEESGTIRCMVNMVGPDRRPCVVAARGSVTISRVSGEAAIILAKMRQLRRDLDAMKDSVSALTALDASMLPDAAEREYLEKELARIRRAVGGSEKEEMAALFKLPRSARGEVLEMRQSMAEEVSQMSEVFAQWARGSWTTANKARVAEITYGQVFSKARRQRRMHERVARNAHLLAEDQARLEKCVADDSAFDDVSEESKEFYTCVLTYSSWCDLAREKDVLGFGVAIGRPECAVDDPTQLRIYNISSTFLAKSAIEDAIAHAIDLIGHIGATGGFKLGREMGVALRGSGREPINAWLPLFINEEHWKAARILLRQIIGYFVTLDPLGYMKEQADAMFLMLGTMVSRLKHPVGEHELKLLFQFQRTCYQVAVDLGMMDQIEAAVREFINVPDGRKDVVKSLLVLIAYVLVLPKSRLLDIFPPGDNTSWETFWTCVLRTTVRRTAFSLFRDFDSQKILGVLQILVEGNLGGDAPIDEATFSEMLAVLPEDIMEDPDEADEPTVPIPPAPADKSKSLDADVLPAPAMRPSRAIVPRTDAFADVTLQSGMTPDLLVEAMETLHTGGDMRELVVRAAGGRAYDANATTASMAEFIRRFGREMNRAGYPSLSALNALLTYATFWKRLNSDAMPGGAGTLLHGLDNRGGLAPQAWIDTCKAAYAPTRALPERETFSAFFRILSGSEATAVVPPCTLRAIMAHGVKYRVNVEQRQWIAAGSYLDYDPTNPMLVLTGLQRAVCDERTAIIERGLHEHLEEARKHVSIHAHSIRAFIAAIKEAMGGSSTRFKPQFPAVLLGFQRTPMVAHRAAKVAIIVSGKIVTREGDRVAVETLFDGGKSWTPGKRNDHRFRRIFGEAEWQAVLRAALMDDVLIGQRPGSDLWEEMFRGFDGPTRKRRTGGT